MEFMSLMASIGVDLAQFKRDLTDAQKAAKTFQRRPEMQGMSLDVEAKLDTEELDDNLDELKDELDDIQEDFEIEGTADIDTSDFEAGVGDIEAMAEGADADVDGDASLTDSEYTDTLDALIFSANNADVDVDGTANLVDEGYKTAIEEIKALAEGTNVNVDGEATMDDSDYTDSLDGLILLAGNSDVDVDGEATLATDGYDTSITSVETSASGADADVDGTASLDITGFDSAVTNAVSRAGDLDDAVDEITTSSGEADTALGGIGSDTDYSGAIGRLDGIKQGLTNIITTAVNAAKAIADVAIDSSTWADDLITESQQYGIDTTTLQQMRYASQFIDTEVGTIEGATQRLTKNLPAISEGTGDVAEAWSALAEATGKDLSIYDASGELRPTLDVFWDIIDALGQIPNETERETLAMSLLGRNVAELNPLIKQGTDAYKEYMDEAPTLAEDNVFVLGKLNDAYQDLESQIEVTKLEMLSELAPSITVATQALAEFVKEFRKFIETEKGQAALQQFNDAITSLVLSLTSEENISSIFSALSDTVSAISDGLKWITQHPGSIVGAFKAIGLAIAGVTIADSVLKFMTLLSNGAILKSLGGLGAGKGLATAGAAAGGGEATAAAAGGSGIWAGLAGFGAAAAGTAAVLAADAAIAYVGTKLLQKNQNTEDIQQIYGDSSVAGSWREGILGSMTPEIEAATRAYAEVYQQTGSEAAMDAREALLQSITDAGFDNPDLATDYIEAIFDEMVNGIDRDGLAEGMEEFLPGITEDVINSAFADSETGDIIEEEVSEGMADGGEAGAMSLDEALAEAGIEQTVKEQVEAGFDLVNIPPINVPISYELPTGPYVINGKRNATAMDGGAILHGLTPFGIDSNGVVQYAGEAGAEAVVGVNSLNEMIQRSVNVAMARVQTVRQPVSVQLVLDSGELLGAVDLGLNDRASWRGGGHA